MNGWGSKDVVSQEYSACGLVALGGSPMNSDVQGIKKIVRKASYKEGSPSEDVPV